MSEADRIARAYRDPARRKGASRWDSRNRGNQAILAERRALTRKVLDEQGWLPLSGRRIIEVGSGGGAELASMVDYGANPSQLEGVDLLPERVEAAREAHPEISFHAGNAERLEFPDASFDLAIAFTLFTSILDSRMAAGVAAEMRRVLRPGGGLLWYDFRYDNPFNRNVRGVGARRVRELFPGMAGRLYTLTLIPQVARRLGPLTPAAYPLLAGLPPLRSHLLGLLIKARSDAL